MAYRMGRHAQSGDAAGQLPPGWAGGVPLTGLSDAERRARDRLGDAEFAKWVNRGRFDPIRSWERW